MTIRAKDCRHLSGRMRPFDEGVGSRARACGVRDYGICDVVWPYEAVRRGVGGVDGPVVSVNMQEDEGITI